MRPSASSVATEPGKARCSRFSCGSRHRPTARRDSRPGRALLEVGTGFHPELTGRENIFLNAAVLGMSRAKTPAQFDEIVDFRRTREFLDMPVKRYSSGMYSGLRSLSPRTSSRTSSSSMRCWPSATPSSSGSA